MRKLILLGIGLALGALIFRRLSRAAGTVSPKALAESASAAIAQLSSAAQAFAADVREGMTEHEATLREAAELDGGHLGRPATP
jgi:hypothetical protein